MDKKAKQILYKYYWKNGWLDENERLITEEDYNYACKKGTMFTLDVESISHDDCICKINKLLNQFSKQSVVDIFVSSLSTRNVYNRSILSSYIQAESLIKHDFKSGNFYCQICENLGLSSAFNIELDRNIMNFEKIKWGGVRLNNVEYILFDLELFRNIVITKPNDEDIKILILEPKKERPTRGRDTDFGYIEDLRGEDGYNMNIAKELFKEYF